MRKLSIVLAFVGALALTACAAGVSDTPSNGHIDAHPLQGGPDANLNPPADAPAGTPDAPPGTPDAPVSPPDANVPPPDAPNALICVQSSDCSSDSCCVSIAGDGSPPGICTFKFLMPTCMP
jgi:hypothetical protein